MFEGLNVTDSFKNSVSFALKNGRLSHAVILEGKNEDIRFAAAKEIAKALLCKGETKPCSMCSCCVKCDKDIHPDLHILEKEADSTMIKVDAVRNIKAKALIFPNEGSKSVFIIREAQYMNPQAQNALLKILEEPSKHVCFILTCPSKSSFLETITSRSTAYSLGEEEYDSKKDEKADEGKSLANELLQIYMSSSEFYFLQKTSVFQKDKALFKAVLTSMVPVIRDALILQSGGNELISGYEDTAKRISSSLTQKKVVRLLEEIKELSEAVNSSANHNLSITRLSAILYDIKSH
ncbi:MAG: hypothetical protein IJ491_07350 [Clostridia bacterium]|nr:hypothetical protein [Clostridia bacterium]